MLENVSETQRRQRQMLDEARQAYENKIMES
jgi:hypothetical protein